MKVVVSQRVDYIETRKDTRDVLDQRLIEWLSKVGALAFPVPNSFKTGDLLLNWLSQIQPQAVVLSGGNDIGSVPSRDATETVLLEYSAQNNLPMLGICRGMQMMACYSGASLRRVQGHSGTRHKIISVGTEIDSPIEVNSYHDWSIDLCPSDYVIIATAFDGTPEMMRHCRRPWQGWMWHPEREDPFVENDIQLARSLFFGVTKS